MIDLELTQKARHEARHACITEIKIAGVWYDVYQTTRQNEIRIPMHCNGFRINTTVNLVDLITVDNVHLVNSVLCGAGECESLKKLINDEK